MQIKWMIAVAAGKGGVGKSTLAVSLARALKRAGNSVGLLDADVYGPSLEQMLPLHRAPHPSERNPSYIVPGEREGICMITTAHFTRHGEAAIVRAPIANSIIDQFLNQVEWGVLDYLIVDFPPGTGDIQLSLMQKGNFSGAILITTPQEVSLLDVRKAAQVFRQSAVPLLGVVENMSYFEDPCGQRHALFGQGGGQRLARELGIPLLGEIPFDAQLSATCDNGESIFERAPHSPSVDAFKKITDTLQQQLLAFPQVDGVAELLQDGTVRLREKVLTPAQIQRCCPCARCRGQGNSRDDVGIIQMQNQGRYALKFTFTSGCCQGIYPFTFLQAL